MPMVDSLPDTWERSVYTIGFAETTGGKVCDEMSGSIAIHALLALPGKELVVPLTHPFSLFQYVGRSTVLVWTFSNYLSPMMATSMISCSLTI